MNDNAKVSELIYKDKYLQAGESFEEGMTRVASALCDGHDHFVALRDILMERRFLPGGRVQSSVGSLRSTTPYNCYVSGTIEDSLLGISGKLQESLQTLRLGGGLGYDFSTLRPQGTLIRSLDSTSCGPVGNSETVGFMDLFDAGCATIRSAGHRRGAQMGVLRVDHPDIYHFIRAKRNSSRLTNFNISVGITDEFMEAVSSDSTFDLRFNGTVYQTIKAKDLWDEIMRSNWDWAEPGVLFIDRINQKNNLWYCETIAATNPCGEQPLPPYGACLLGSFNLTAYLSTDLGGLFFDSRKLIEDIPTVVRAMDNVVDRAIYPLPQQEQEAKNKRRMGLGVTGFANVSEALHHPYAGVYSKGLLSNILHTIKVQSYKASVELAKEKGSFKLFDADKYTSSGFLKESMPEDVVESIARNGIRNSHLTSIAPTGTISLAAGNVSSGIEPTFASGEFTRKMIMPDGSVREFTMQDYGEAAYGYKAKDSSKTSAKEHVEMLTLASREVDSAVSKTCNVGSEVTYDEFCGIYQQAYDQKASGCTTFRAGGKRFGILNAKKPEEATDTFEEGSACYINPETGERSCE